MCLKAVPKLLKGTEKETIWMEPHALGKRDTDKGFSPDLGKPICEPGMILREQLQKDAKRKATNGWFL